MAMCYAALITLFTPFEYLSDATSISTLFSFFLVAACLLWRRYYGQGGAAAGASPWPPAVLIAWLVLSAAGAPALSRSDVLCYVSQRSSLPLAFNPARGEATQARSIC